MGWEGGRGVDSLGDFLRFLQEIVTGFVFSTRRQNTHKTDQNDRFAKEKGRKKQNKKNTGSAITQPPAFPSTNLIMPGACLTVSMSCDDKTDCKT